MPPAFSIIVNDIRSLGLGELCVLVRSLTSPIFNRASSRIWAGCAKGAP
jgi:hypothetical protein